MKATSCIFCGKTPVTREDLFSKWILKLLEDNFDTETSRKGARGKSGAAFWTSDGANRTFVRCVCATCNNGWMSDIEQVVKPTLSEMILGEGVALDTQAQESLASWACLKAMIGAHSQRTHAIPSDWLAHLYRNHRPPDGWHVMTTRYLGKNLQVFDSGRALLRFSPSDETGPTPTEGEAIMTTFIIGYFAVKVFALREPHPLKVHSAILKLWPASSLTLVWPPDVQITDGRTFDNFRRMGFEPGPDLFNLPPRS